MQAARFVSPTRPWLSSFGVCADQVFAQLENVIVAAHSVHADVTLQSVHVKVLRV